MRQCNSALGPYRCRPDPARLLSSTGGPTKEDAHAPVSAIEAVGVVKRFGDMPRSTGWTCSVEAGEVHGLVGPNGAGKTTLLRVLFGLVRLDGGSMRLLGRESAAPGRGRPGCRRVRRGAPLLSLSHRPAEPRAARPAGRRRSPRRESTRCSEVVRLSERGGDKVGGFSSGMRQRLGFAASLLRSPRLLLLDEPTVGLDPAGAREMRDLVARLAAGRHHGVAEQPRHGRARRTVRRRDRHAVRAERVGGLDGAPARRGARARAPHVDERRRARGRRSRGRFPRSGRCPTRTAG